MGELLHRTQHGLIDQSLHSRMGAETTNGDGFGGELVRTSGPQSVARFSRPTAIRLQRPLAVRPQRHDPGIAALRRDLLMAVDPSLFNDITGSTDSELVFHLALTLGLEDDPHGAMEQAIGFVESTASKRGVASPVQGTFGMSDGERLWAIRYSSDHDSRTLFVSADIDALSSSTRRTSGFSG